MNETGVIAGANEMVCGVCGSTRKLDEVVADLDCSVPVDGKVGTGGGAVDSSSEWLRDTLDTLRDEVPDVVRGRTRRGTSLPPGPRTQADGAPPTAGGSSIAGGTGSRADGVLKLEKRRPCTKISQQL